MLTAVGQWPKARQSHFGTYVVEGDFAGPADCKFIIFHANKIAGDAGTFFKFDLGSVIGRIALKGAEPFIVYYCPGVDLATARCLAPTKIV